MRTTPDSRRGRGQRGPRAPVSRARRPAGAILFAAAPIIGALAPVPSRAASLTPTLVLGNPSLREFQPPRGGGFLLLQQNSTTHPNHYHPVARPHRGGAQIPGH